MSSPKKGSNNKWIVVCVKWCNLFHYKDRNIVFVICALDCDFWERILSQLSRFTFLFTFLCTFLCTLPGTRCVL